MWTLLWTNKVLHRPRHPGMTIPLYINTHKQWNPMVSKWCRIPSIHSIKKKSTRVIWEGPKEARTISAPKTSTPSFGYAKQGLRAKICRMTSVILSFSHSLSGYGGHSLTMRVKKVHLVDLGSESKMSQTPAWPFPNVQTAEKRKRIQHTVGCGSNRYPKWNPGKWKHGLQPALQFLVV